MAVASCFSSGSNSTSASRLASSTARDPVADPLKGCQLLLLCRSLPLDIAMDHVAGLRPLLAAHGFSGLLGIKTGSPETVQLAAFAGVLPCAG